MIDSTYRDWFYLRTRLVVNLTWCSATKIDDVLAAYAISPESTQPARFLADDVDMFIGRLGKGTVIMDYRVDSTTDQALPILAQYGPCLSATWIDDAPAMVSYRTESGLVVEFDMLEWDWYPVPDLASVEQWIAASPAGRETWENSCGLATLITAEALCQAVVDDEWMRSVHTGVTSPDPLGQEMPSAPQTLSSIIEKYGDRTP
ncbi:hypothetical protein [Streptosporangium vulgare]|uniref:YubB ferredoxin-like domain-containing protein n=2 Tax=Streptosporangium vulgare TaxID=46190 RepID=A0ABV5TL33_9ACTN